MFHFDDSPHVFHQVVDIFFSQGHSFIFLLFPAEAGRSPTGALNWSVWYEMQESFRSVHQHSYHLSRKITWGYWTKCTRLQGMDFWILRKYYIVLVLHLFTEYVPPSGAIKLKYLCTWRKIINPYTNKNMRPIGSRYTSSSVVWHGHSIAIWLGKTTKCKTIKKEPKF